jgi:hypothetical protein
MKTPINQTDQDQASRRAQEFRTAVRLWIQAQRPDQQPGSAEDGAYDFCCVNPGGDLHPGNLIPRAVALLDELHALVDYLGTAPDSGHPMHRLATDPEFRAWFNADTDDPPPPLAVKE